MRMTHYFFVLFIYFEKLVEIPMTRIVIVDKKLGKIIDSPYNVNVS